MGGRWCLLPSPTGYIQNSHETIQFPFSISLAIATSAAQAFAFTVAGQFMGLCLTASKCLLGNLLWEGPGLAPAPGSDRCCLSIAQFSVF